MPKLPRKRLPFSVFGSPFPHSKPPHPGATALPAPDPAPDPDAETGIGAQAEFAGSEICDRPDWCRHVVAGAFEECAC